MESTYQSPVLFFSLYLVMNQEYLHTKCSLSRFISFLYKELYSIPTGDSWSVSPRKRLLTESRYQSSVDWTLSRVWLYLVMNHEYLYT